MARGKATWLGFVLFCAGTGCATHMTAVRPLPPEKEAEINGVVAGRAALLTIEGEPRTLLSKDVRLDGNSVRLRANDPTWPEGAAWLPETERPLASVRRIEVRDHGRGFFYGLGIGAGIGVALSTIAAIEFKCRDAVDVRCPPSTAVPFVVKTTLIFGLLGAAMGGAAGAPRVIEFKDAPSH
jgi:hypothetical protein